MAEQNKPKITLSFTENRKRIILKQFKKPSKFYLIVVFVRSLARMSKLSFTTAWNNSSQVMLVS